MEDKESLTGTDFFYISSPSYFLFPDPLPAMTDSSPSPIVGQMPQSERIIHLVLGGAGLVCLAIGYLMVRQGMEVVRLARESSSWPESEARVTYAKSEYHDGGSTGSSQYEPVVHYRYTVNGVEYEGDTIFFGSKSYQNRSGKARSQEVVSRYANYPLVPLRVNPQRPEQSVLEPGVTLRTYDSMGWALVFLIAGLALILFDLWLVFAPTGTASEPQSEP